MSYLIKSLYCIGLFTILILTSCDPVFTNFWKVENLTSGTIEVTAIEPLGTTQVSLDPNETAIVSEEGTIGTVEDEEIKIILDSLIITNSKGILMKKDVNNTANWIKNIVNDEKVEFIIQVRNGDF